MFKWNLILNLHFKKTPQCKSKLGISTLLERELLVPFLIHSKVSTSHLRCTHSVLGPLKTSRRRIIDKSTWFFDQALYLSGKMIGVALTEILSHLTFVHFTLQALSRSQNLFHWHLSYLGYLLSPLCRWWLF